MLQFDNVGTYLNFLTGSEHQPGGHVRCRRAQIPVALPLCHEWEVVWRHRGAFSRHASEGASSLTQGHKLSCCRSPIHAQRFCDNNGPSCLVARVAWHRFCENGPGSENPTCGDAAGSGVSPNSQTQIVVITVMKVNYCVFSCKNMYIFTNFNGGTNSSHCLVIFLTATLWVCVETEQTTVGYVASTRYDRYRYASL